MKRHFNARKGFWKTLIIAIAMLLCVSIGATAANTVRLPGDMDRDGKITPEDARIVLRCAVKLDSVENYMGDHTDPGEKQKLVVGFDAEFPPFSYIAADGTYDGFDLALAKELCRRLGWDYELVPIDWDAKDAALASGAIDCIWSGFCCTGREDQYTWSHPYVDNSCVLVVRADSGITSLGDLVGKSVMVQTGSSAADAIDANEEFKNSLKEVVQLSDYNTGFMYLDSGKADAVAADMGVASFMISANRSEYTILSEPLSSEQYAIGFQLGNTELRHTVNTELLKMAKDGTMMSIAQNYVDEGLVLESLCLCR